MALKRQLSTSNIMWEYLHCSCFFSQCYCCCELGIFPHPFPWERSRHETLPHSQKLTGKISQLGSELYEQKWQAAILNFKVFLDLSYNSCVARNPVLHINLSRQLKRKNGEGATGLKKLWTDTLVTDHKVLYINETCISDPSGFKSEWFFGWLANRWF